MEVHDLEQPASVVDQLWMRHPNEAVGGKHNGRMDEDDMGPETDVDSVDDVLLSPSIAAAKAMVSQAQANTTTTTTATSVWPQERLQKEQQIWLQTLPWSYADVVRKSPPKKPTVQEDIKVNKLTEPETPVVPPLPVQHEPQLDTVLDNAMEAKEKQEAEDLVEQILQDSAVITKGEEIKNYVGDNDVDSGEESEEEWNYIPGKESPKETQKQIQQIQQELNVEEEDMESQLNPNAAEFVPVFIPPSSAAAIEQDLSSSPAKGAEQSLENIDVPSSKEFYTEISKRPSELESLNEDTNKSFNETTLNGVNTTGISTKAVYGGDDTLSFLSNSTVPNIGEEEDEAIEIAVPLNDTNPFSPTHVATEPVIGNSADTIQEQMVQDHFSLGFKPFDPMTQSVLEDEGQHEDETSPDIDFMSSGKPDLLSPETNQAPISGAEANEALEAQTSSSGFDSESGPDDGDHIPAEQCNLAAAAAAVGISFGEDINIDDIVNNTKSMSLIDDSHPIEKIEQTISPSLSPMPALTIKEDIEEKEIDELKADVEVKEEIVTKVLTEVQEVKSTSPVESPIASKADETLLQFTDEEISTPAANNVEPFDIPVHMLPSSIEENDKVTVEEILIKDVTPRQLVDLVQELQFNQVNKNKEEEPESDSGFEIINASEASNEPDLIETETTSRLQQVVEDSVAPNYVPDLLLQPSESETDRQPSPVGTGTGDIVADIEGAMLDSTPPMEQTMPEDSSLETVESEVKEQKLEETKSVLLFEEEKVTDEHLEQNKLPLPIDLEKEKLVKPTLEVDDHVQVILENSVPEFEDREQINESQPSGFEELYERPLTPKEQIPESSTADDEAKEVIKETISVEEDKCTEMGESPIVEDVSSKSSPFENADEKVVEETLLTETAVGKEEIKEQVVSMDIEKLLPAPEANKVICVFKEEPTLVQLESESIKEEKEIPLVVDEDTVKCEEVLPSQPTPPSTPAPGVTQQSNEQELIAAAIAAAGVAVAGAGAAAVAVSVTESPKVEEKTATVQKKPTGTSVTPVAKKLDSSKTPTAKSSSVTAKSPAKPGALSTGTKKPSPAVGTTSKGAKPAGTGKPSTPSSKPSTPISKTAPTNRPPSAKPGTPTNKTSTVSAATKSPPKPRTPTSAKSAPTTTAKAATGTAAAKPAKPTSQTTSARPSSVTATKKPEPAAIKKTVSNATTAALKATAPAVKANAPSKPTSAPKLTVAKPGSATTTKSLAGKAPTATATSMKPSATSASTAKPATKTNITATTKTTATKAPVAAKTLTAAKSASANSAASKAPVSKTKPAAPTAIKKPLSNDKNVKDATNNKLSAVKQTGAVKKQEVKAKPTNETKEIEPLTQEPTVTTTNGHIENGISNEESSPVEIAYPQTVQALN